MRKQLMMVLQGGGGEGGGGGGAVGMEEEGWQGEQSAVPQGADAHCTRTVPTQTPLPFTPAKILGHVVCTHAWSSCPPPLSPTLNPSCSHLRRSSGT